MKKILLVDDDFNLRQSIKEYLETVGYAVVEAESGQSGLEVFEEESPSLVISDVSMPDLNGLEFCRCLRSKRVGQLVPFIFLSGLRELDTRIKGHQMGADDYLVKPFVMQELLFKIEALLNRYQLIHEEVSRLLQFVILGNQAEAKNHHHMDLPHSEPPLTLTPAEERVFWEVAKGLSNKEIADSLFISENTVSSHVSKILRKLNLKNRYAIISLALERGWQHG
ncbi:MAG TPA: response regulator transcription factor [Oscillatoriaceae cyanobacterium M33_DOE_052]|uniref:Response regulator transcription factor n=1 Tax=Planktothricoides sp. SpSt-374 TaxID=2282167 RepID=A0A7C3ZUG3_9CYAN|nr:response regulator transcription factor [Oscillatoriaceae cyanobacterium M33_DOE_052]